MQFPLVHALRLKLASSLDCSLLIMMYPFTPGVWTGIVNLIGLTLQGLVRVYFVGSWSATRLTQALF